jgi:hypothetical protein
MWFDQQALQLRFNVLSDEVVALPFECKVHIEIAAEVVLSNFITTVKKVALYGDNIEFFNNQEYLDEDEEQEYVLDVFVKELITVVI